jgi:hypothetical protein
MIRIVESRIDNTYGPPLKVKGEGGMRRKVPASAELTHLGNLEIGVISDFSATASLRVYRHLRLIASGKALWLWGKDTNVRQSKRAVSDYRSTDRRGRSALLQSLSGSKATRGPPDKCWPERREDPGKVVRGRSLAHVAVSVTYPGPLSVLHRGLAFRLISG